MQGRIVEGVSSEAFHGSLENHFDHSEVRLTSAPIWKIHMVSGVQVEFFRGLRTDFLLQGIV